MQIMEIAGEGIGLSEEDLRLASMTPAQLEKFIAKQEGEKEMEKEKSGARNGRK